MLQKKCKDLSRNISYAIIGAYLVGAGERIASIDKNTPLKTLGESFCLYNDKEPLDFTQRSLIDLNDFGSAPAAGGVTSSLINQCNRKMQQKADFLDCQNIPIAESISLLSKYAKKLEKAAVDIAMGEGALDDDLKEDFKTLLKEAKNEFIKREEEEQTKEEAQVQDNNFVEDQGFDQGENEDGFDDFGGNEEFEADDSNFEDDGSEEEFGEENNGVEEEFGEESSADEDFGIPSGNEGESYTGYNTEGKKAFGESANERLSRRREERRKRIDLVSKIPGFESIDVMNDEEFSELLSKRNDLYTYGENAKFVHNGSVINIPPAILGRMKNELLEIEKASIKMLGESFKLNNVVDDSTLAMKHKSTVNELALILAARNKFGFR